MATYVLSDIHGDYQRYMQMLTLIDLQDEDTLYVLGDVIDRGTEGVKILQDMMFRANVYPILGNHEFMAAVVMPWLLQEMTEESVDNTDEDTIQSVTEWLSQGGESTIAELFALSMEERKEVLDYIMEFELYAEVSAGGKEFLLVHAGLENFSPKRDLSDYSIAELIFHRPDLDKTYFEDRYVVFGHTPTRLLYAVENNLNLKELETNGYQDEIFVKDKLIGIDCGCAFGGRLGCICLDTMECFYV